MDVRTRFDDSDEVLASLADAVQMRIRTAIPVMLTEDSDGHVVSLQPLVKGTRRQPDGSVGYIDLPLLTGVPIQHASGGGVTITLPHKQGNTGLAIISDRSLDAWQQQGGVQQQIDARMHNLADAIYIPGIRADPQRLKDVSTTSTQIRSDDGKHLSDWNPTAGTITHSVDGGKHVVSMDPAAGLKLLADAGKHVLTLHPEHGIGIQTVKALALKAAGGTSMDGGLNVTGNITASGKIGAPSLSGFLSAFSGTLVGLLTGAALLMALAGAGDPSAAPQRAAYTLASVWRAAP